MPDQVASPATPLGKVALALSGGGYRAAGFHLGTLDTLFAVGLLDRVVALSTVSGGTVVGAAYALSVARGEPYDDFYQEFHEQLQERPLDDALHLLLRTAAARQLPADTLIAAQAEAYDRIFYHQARFDEILDSRGHLHEVAFNATDFAAGLPFRFQKSDHAQVKIGNGRHWMPREVAVELRLADLVAASSCFPAGFEPIGFPSDFQWRDAARIERALADCPAGQLQHGIPLMDGGVADNQGVGSLLAAVKRLEDHATPETQVGLILVSDVDRPVEGPLLEFARPPRRGHVRLRVVAWAMRLVFLAAVASFLGLGWKLGDMLYSGTFSLWADLLQVYVPIGLSFSVAVMLWWIHALLKNEFFDRLPDLGLDLQDVLERTPVTLLAGLIWMRAQSLVAMSSDVFMKSLRDLRYRELFSRDRYREVTVADLIYDLSRSHFRARAGLPDWLRPTPAMQEIAEGAKNMPTILWFENERQLPDVVACGRFTTCFALLAHFVKRYGPDFAQASGPDQVVCQAAREFWTRLREDPYAEPEREPPQAAVRDGTHTSTNR